MRKGRRDFKRVDKMDVTDDEVKICRRCIFLINAFQNKIICDGEDCDILRKYISDTSPYPNQSGE